MERGRVGEGKEGKNNFICSPAKVTAASFSCISKEELWALEACVCPHGEAEM